METLPPRSTGDRPDARGDGRDPAPTREGVSTAMATQTAARGSGRCGPPCRPRLLGPPHRSRPRRAPAHMLLMRSIEERAMTLYRQGKVPGSFYDGFGQEAVSVGGGVCDGAPRTASASCTATSARTSCAASTRRGSSPSTWAARAASRGGRDGNIHFGDHTIGCVGDGLDAPRHDARRDGHGDGVQAARRARVSRSPGSATARPRAATGTRR